jgi:site-specific DNA recombinase
MVLALQYVRVSSDEQATNGTSLDAQTRECHRYISDHDWILGDLFSDILSGRRTDRPGYQALLTRVRALRAERRTVVVVVAALDRFGRRVLERVRRREELKALGVATHSTREGGEVSDLVANVLASVAEEEVRRTGERVRAAWTNLASQGWFKTAGWLPWGYRSRMATPDDRAAGSPLSVLELEPVSAPFVRQVFQRIAAGESTGSVTRWAAALPAHVRGTYRGSERQLDRRTVNLLLRNDVYVAAAPARWEAIVDQPTWDKVQKVLDAHAAAPRAKPTEYKLSGFLACPACGSRMNGDRGRGGRHSRYRCQAGTRICYVSVGAEQVDNLVLAEVGARMRVFIGTDRTRLERAWARLAKPDDDAFTTRELRRVEQQIETASRRIGTATRLFVDGQISKPAYDGMVATEQATLEVAERERARMRSVSRSVASLPPLATVLDLSNNWLVNMLVMHETLSVLVQRVIPVRLGRGQYGVDINWTATGAAVGDLRAVA